MCEELLVSSDSDSSCEPVQKDPLSFYRRDLPALELKNSRMKALFPLKKELATMTLKKANFVEMFSCKPAADTGNIVRPVVVKRPAQKFQINPEAHLRERKSQFSVHSSETSTRPSTPAHRILVKVPRSPPMRV